MLSLRLVQGKMHLHSAPTTAQEAADGPREVRVTSHVTIAMFNSMHYCNCMAFVFQLITDVLQDRQKIFSVWKTVLCNLKQDSRLLVVDNLRI